MKTAGKLMLILAIVGMMAMSASAFPVAGVGKRGFADFSKAIVFDTNGFPCPKNAETIALSTSGEGCAIPMQPVGDGSWVCTATIYAGTQYKYYFEYRIPAFEDTAGWKKSGVTRNQDKNRIRTITVPGSATGGYIFYNMIGDADVTGKQGMAQQGTAWDTELTTANPDVASYKGTVDVSSSGTNDTHDLDNSNPYSMSVQQTSDSVVKISWKFNISAADELAPSVEGAREFDTTSALTPYGFKILRARLPSGWNMDSATPTHLKFEDTVVNQVMGDSYYSPNRPNGWYDNANSFTDTSFPVNGTATTGDSFVYTVVRVDAYNNIDDTAGQNFSGGAANWVVGSKIDALFLVENFDPKVVFPNGATEGRVRVTPWVDGVPVPSRAFWTKLYLATKSS